MASRTLLELTDDLDGGPADRQVTFGYGGRLYEIDLSEKNAAKMAGVLEPYLEHARDVTFRQRHTRRRTTAQRRRTAEQRQWARENGFEVSDNGRLSTHVIQKWIEAHPGEL